MVSLGDLECYNAWIVGSTVQIDIKRYHTQVHMLSESTIILVVLSQKLCCDNAKAFKHLQSHHELTTILFTIMD